MIFWMISTIDHKKYWELYIKNFCTIFNVIYTSILNTRFLSCALSERDSRNRTLSVTSWRRNHSRLQLPDNRRYQFWSFVENISGKKFMNLATTIRYLIYCRMCTKSVTEKKSENSLYTRMIFKERDLEREAALSRLAHRINHSSPTSVYINC